MKKLFIILTISFIAFTSCSKQEYGELSGNVFWKYNDYVGNKPDAGAKIKLIQLDDKDSIYKTTSDVNGNYIFEKTKIGKYLLFIISNNTKICADEFMNELDKNKDILKTKFNFDFDKYKSTYDEYKKIRQKEKDLLIESTQTSDPKKSIENIDKQIELVKKKGDLEIKLIKQMKDEKLFKELNFFPISEKIKIIPITIQPNKKEKIVTDFGITCR